MDDIENNEIQSDASSQKEEISEVNLLASIQTQIYHKKQLLKNRAF